MEKQKKENQNNKNKTIESDFYYEANGNMVFTAIYHLKRGYCCQMGCRHCPWDFKKK